VDNNVDKLNSELQISAKRTQVINFRDGLYLSMTILQQLKSILSIYAKMCTFDGDSRPLNIFGRTSLAHQRSEVQCNVVLLLALVIDLCLT